MWNGIYAGCNCKGISGGKGVRKPNGLVAGSCRFEERELGCSNVEQSDPTRMESFCGKIICKQIIGLDVSISTL